MSYGRYRLEREWLAYKYWVEQMTLKEIAEEVGCHFATVGKAMKHYGIERRPSAVERRAIPEPPKRSSAKPERPHRGRVVYGTDHPKAKLTPMDVLAIVDRLNSGEHEKDIAPDFGVDRRTVYDVKHGRRWEWLTGINHELTQEERERRVWRLLVDLSRKVDELASDRD